MKLFKKKKTPHVAADLSSVPGRARAEHEMTFGDHGFLRESFQNLHQISDEMWRANQPNPRQVAEHGRLRGIKTIINLRGPSTRGYYLLEKEACDAVGIELIDFQVFSRDTPTREVIFAAKDLFETITYPAMMHCKSGADRAGIMSVLYMIFRQGQTVEQAKSQLSKKYLHLREGKTGVLDAVFEAYLAYAETHDADFETWVRDVYDREAIKSKFMASRKSKLNFDKILGRE